MSKMLKPVCSSPTRCWIGSCQACCTLATVQQDVAFQMHPTAAFGSFAVTPRDNVTRVGAHVLHNVTDQPAAHMRCATALHVHSAAPHSFAVSTLLRHCFNSQASVLRHRNGSHAKAGAAGNAGGGCICHRCGAGEYLDSLVSTQTCRCWSVVAQLA